MIEPPQIRGRAPNALDFTNQRTRKAGCEVDEVKKAKNRNKSKIHSRVEHVFAVVERLWASTRFATADWPGTRPASS